MKDISIFCLWWVAFYFTEMPNSIEFYKGIFLHKNPVCIIVSCQLASTTFFRDTILNIPINRSVIKEVKMTLKRYQKKGKQIKWHLCSNQYDQ